MKKVRGTGVVVCSKADTPTHTPAPLDRWNTPSIRQFLHPAERQEGGVELSRG